MEIGGSVIVLVIAWWIAFQAMLAVGVRSPSELELKPGEYVGDPGAPVRPDLLKKVIWSTIIAIAIWAALFAFFRWSGLTFQTL